MAANAHITIGAIIRIGSSPRPRSKKAAARAGDDESRASLAASALPIKDLDG
jgi:hypothetical protein